MTITKEEKIAFRRACWKDIRKRAEEVDWKELLQDTQNIKKINKWFNSRLDWIERTHLIDKAKWVLNHPWETGLDT